MAQARFDGAVVGKDVLSPNEPSRRRIDHAQIARRPESVDSAFVPGGSRARPVSPEALLKESVPGVNPEFFSRAEVVASDSFPAAALLDREHPPLRHHDRGVTAADLLAPQFGEPAVFPVGADRAFLVVPVALGTAKISPIGAAFDGGPASGFRCPGLGLLALFDLVKM